MQYALNPLCSVVWERQVTFVVRYWNTERGSEQLTCKSKITAKKETYLWAVRLQTHIYTNTLHVMCSTGVNVVAVCREKKTNLAQVKMLWLSIIDIENHCKSLLVTVNLLLVWIMIVLNCTFTPAVSQWHRQELENNVLAQKKAEHEAW